MGDQQGEGFGVPGRAERTGVEGWKPTSRASLVGWRLKRAVVAEELAETTPFARRACVFLLRTVCPVAILVVLAAKLLR